MNFLSFRRLGYLNRLNYPLFLCINKLSNKIMMLLDCLPHELQLQVISDLDNQDLQTLLQSNGNLLTKSKQDTFWKDLCTLKGISYHHPDVAWKELYQSGSVNTMCPHLRLRGIQDKKKEQFWYLLDQKSMDSSLMFCLHSSCEFLGKYIHSRGQMKKILTVRLGQEQEFAKHSHHTALTLSPLHILEIWCDSCSKIITLNKDACGHHGIKSEQHMLQGLLKDFTSLSEQDPELSKKVTNGRRRIEKKLYKLQARFTPDYIIEKEWYMAWLEFIAGKSNDMPGPLKNQKLLRPDNTLNPELSLGQNFEIVPELLKRYIEKFYGISGPFISIDDLQWSPEYCKIVHKIKLRHQMQQTRFASPLILTA
ncbi:unnamed protein product [Rhizopus stolonifer]